MTDLQITLFGAGGVFIVGVFSYNKWQEYKAKKSVERAFSTDHDDVLMRDGDAPVADVQEPVLRQEPRFDAAPAAKAEPSFGAPPATAVPDAPVHAEPSLAGAAEPAPAPAVAPAAEPVQEVSAASEQATSLVDPLIDCLLPLSLEAPVRGDKILPVLQTLRLVGNKPVHFIGLHVNGDWEPITHGGVYTRMQGGVQLASRSTALNELEYSELVTRLRGVADDIGAEPEVPDMMEVMAEARNLHRFVAGHDAQLGVNLHTNGAPWAISTLLVALEKQGFDVRPDGRFVMPDGDGGHLFSLSTNVTLAEETTPRLTLLLDVPCVAPARDGFGAMVACARALVGRLDATIVDDYNQALSDAALAEIAGQVQEFYQEMDAADIPAGSTRALRLFS
ncbi:cell division protein ZipA C-terminal FtsZ-binding domain-containing protein [Janthinobacterium sp. GW458P]|uniref:cell division protein ZipA C-terminal FtsZ-binding domain-containing protein n=1 Tax=Janthinobacterium sp. GW458P TaxID=1981504 RepID=UPI000A3228D9|nr:cell division protein ZipA C-terminal FtsZ-binding domain-containing protein [Janthinobacterium sp. GW458P]MBE3024263.1 cell division protein [Janthinobacterium sp. GW458P]PHV13864.1 cell division protein [Janthinobacterium sp. BJB303]